MNKHAPLKTIILKPDMRFQEPWLTVQIQKYNSKCRKLCNKARLSGNQSDFSRYKQYHNILNRIKKHEKQVFYDSLFKKIGKNTKLMWNVINNLIKKTNNKHDIVELISDSNVLSNDRDKCNLLNEHFVNAGQKVQDSIPQPGITGDNTVNRKSDTKSVRSKLSFRKVTEGEICKIVANLKLKSSYGIDYISNNLSKKLVHIIRFSVRFSTNLWHVESS